MCSGRSAWSTEEVLSLLNAIEKYSYGNWSDIAQQIGTKTATKTKNEYVKRFLKGSVGRATWSSVTHHKCKFQNLMQTDNAPLSSHIFPVLPHLDILPEEAQMLYYHPLRNVFEIEYDNQAETLVSSLSLTTDDDDLDIALKLAQVDMYTERLRERERRHRIIRDHQLIAHFFRKNKTSKNTSEIEMILRQKFLPLCQFYTCEELKKFIENLMTQYKLSKRLTELLQYRQFGITDFDNVLDFEKQKNSKWTNLQQVPLDTVQSGKRKNMRRHKKKRLTFSNKVQVLK